MPFPADFQAANLTLPPLADFNFQLDAVSAVLRRCFVMQGSLQEIRVIDIFAVQAGPLQMADRIRVIQAQVNRFQQSGFAVPVHRAD